MEFTFELPTGGVFTDHISEAKLPVPVINPFAPRTTSQQRSYSAVSVQRIAQIPAGLKIRWNTDPPYSCQFQTRAVIADADRVGGFR